MASLGRDTINSYNSISGLGVVSLTGKGGSEQWNNHNYLKDAAVVIEGPA
jgi:hypothetical protein